MLADLHWRWGGCCPKIEVAPGFHIHLRYAALTAALVKGIDLNDPDRSILLDASHGLVHILGVNGARRQGTRTNDCT